MADRITYVGLDVHKERIVVAVAEGGLRGEVREYGRIANTAAALDRLVRKLGGDGVKPAVLLRSGAVRLRHSASVVGGGHECVVVAPSLIPSERATGSRPTGGMPPAWPAAPGGRADRGVGSRCRARGDARSGARAS